LQAVIPSCIRRRIIESAALLVDDVSNKYPLMTQKILSHLLTNNDEVIELMP
jgi:hypothetical protein